MNGPRAKRVAITCLASLIAIAAVGGAAYGYWALVEHRFITVTEGQVYRSGAMPPAKLIEKLEEHGIRAVVDFRTDEAEVEAERSALEAAGIKHFHVPSRQVPQDHTVEAFLEIVADPENRPVLMHCEHGTGRAPLYAAIYRIEFEEWSNDHARSTAWLRSGFGGFEAEDKKGRFLLEYEPASRESPTEPPLAGNSAGLQ